MKTYLTGKFENKKSMLENEFKKEEIFPEPKKGWLGQKYKSLLFLASITLSFEKFWIQIWPILALLLLFLIISFLDVLPNLPFFLHTLVLLLFGGALVFLILKLCRVDYKSDFKEVMARLNRDNNLSHDPLGLLIEKNVFGETNEKSNLLWISYKRRVIKNLPKLRVKLPSPGVSKHDLFAIRLVLILTTIITFFIGGSDVKLRIARALVPEKSMGTSVDSKINLWVIPPERINLAPIFAEYNLLNQKSLGKNKISSSLAPKANSNRLVEIPIDSKVTVQVSGISRRPNLILAGRTIPMAQLETKDSRNRFQVETEIKNEDIDLKELSVTANTDVLISLPIKVIPDLVPEVEFLSPPKRSVHGNFNFAINVKDDFSVNEIWAKITPNYPSKKFVSPNEHKFEIFFPDSGAEEVKVESHQNFSAHPWAGTSVKLQIFAKDSKGQVGKSTVFPMVLPERIFNHPIARSLIEIRKKLNGATDRVITESGLILSELNNKPEHYFHRINVFLNIAIARARLKYSSLKREILSVQNILWKTALLIEDGEFSVAENELKNIWKEIGRAYNKTMDPKKFDHLLEKLSAALEKYLGALAKHLKNQGFDQSVSEALSQTLETKNLQNILSKARSLAKSGSKELAYKMLSKLNRMLRGIREGVRVGRSDPWAQAARKMMDSLRGITKRQQTLVDKNYRSRNNNRLIKNEPKTFSVNPSQTEFGQKSERSKKTIRQSEVEGFFNEAKNAQDKLRKELEQVTAEMGKMLGSVSGPLGKAEGSMESAIKKLGMSDLDGGISEQLKALEELRRGTEQTSEEVVRRLRTKSGQRYGRNLGHQGAPKLDPFGRPEGGLGGQINEAETIKIPTDRVIHRSREIFDELHRRSAEHQRPILELEFIDRLLERF